MMAKEIGDKAGGDKKSENYQNHSYNYKNDFSDNAGTAADYLTARIARDDPQVYADMLKGKYKSVRAAAIDAGIVAVGMPTIIEGYRVLCGQKSKNLRLGLILGR